MNGVRLTSVLRVFILRQGTAVMMPKGCWGELNEIIHVRPLEIYLVHSKCENNIFVIIHVWVYYEIGLLKNYFTGVVCVPWEIHALTFYLNLHEAAPFHE